MTASDPTLTSIARNDLGAARRFYEARGRLSSTEMATLLQLQDDPAKLVEMARDWVLADDVYDFDVSDAQLDASLRGK